MPSLKTLIVHAALIPCLAYAAPTSAAVAGNAEPSPQLGIYVRPSSATITVEQKSRKLSFATDALTALGSAFGLQFVGDVAGRGIDRAREVAREKHDANAEDRIADAANSAPIQELLRQMRASLATQTAGTTVDLGLRRVYPLLPAGSFEAPETILANQQLLKHWLATAIYPDFSELQGSNLSHVLDVELGCKLVKYKGNTVLPTVVVKATLINITDNKVIASLSSHFGKLDSAGRREATMNLPETLPLEKQRHEALITSAHKGRSRAERRDARAKAKMLAKEIAAAHREYALANAAPLDTFSTDDATRLLQQIAPFIDASALTIRQWLDGFQIAQVLPESQTLRARARIEAAP